MPTPRPLALALLALALLPSPACQAPAPAPAARPLTLANACQDRATAICALFSRCQPHHLLSTFGDVATCQRQLILECATDAAIVGPGYLPAAVEACALEALDSACAALAFPAPVGPACAKIKQSPEAPGAVSCTSDLQCYSGACDLGSTVSGCGNCVPFLSADQSCTPPFGDFCDFGLYCALETSTCTAVAQQGELCGSALSAGDVCDVGLGCSNGLCASLLGKGGACNSGSTALCDPAQELACDLKQGRCAAQPAVIRGVGESCAASGSAAIFCGPRAFCAASGVCQAFAEDGQPCDASVDASPCLFPDVCVDASCSVPDPPSCTGAG